MAVEALMLSRLLMEMLPNEEMVKGVIEAVTVCGATIQCVVCYFVLHVKSPVSNLTHAVRLRQPDLT
jgi:hypothetical protein